MGGSSRSKKRGGLNGKSSVPEDLDTQKEEESEDSLNIHSASYRKVAIKDSWEGNTNHYSGDETDSCEKG